MVFWTVDYWAELLAQKWAVGSAEMKVVRMDDLTMNQQNNA